MRLLLDTHAFLWWVADAPELSRRARAAIAEPANECVLSLASAWEMAIKLSLGSLTRYIQFRRPSGGGFRRPYAKLQA